MDQQVPHEEAGEGAVERQDAVVGLRAVEVLPERRDDRREENDVEHGERQQRLLLPHRQRGGSRLGAVGGATRGIRRARFDERGAYGGRSGRLARMIYGFLNPLGGQSDPSTRINNMPV